MKTTKLLSIAFVALFAISPVACAMGVANYEENLTKQLSTDTVERTIATVGLKAYLAGVAETYRSLKMDDGTVWWNGKRAICFPRNLEVTADLMQTLINQEIKNPMYRERIGADWKSYLVSYLVFYGAVRSFPCN